MTALRDRVWALIKRFLFLMDAERAHRLTLALIRFGNRWNGKLVRRISGVEAPSAVLPEDLPEIFGMPFLSRVGLAAGFDKDAEILTALPHLGFGFAEIGTVTPRPQPGNAPPRLFRDPVEKAVFNRMGFNGQGAVVVSRRLAEARNRLPAPFRVGVNIGKNKDTPLENAAEDYVQAARPFEGLAHYIVINVSSPNTPGLRSLQSVQSLRPIVEGVLELVAGKWREKVPVLLKLAPELKGNDLAEIIRAAEEWGIGGWVLTNTLAGKRVVRAGKMELEGGWSGGPLTEASRESLRAVKARTRLPVISVGGIMSVEEGVTRRSLGADLIQIYSGWVFNGPAFPAGLARRIR